MKKALFSILSLLLCFALVACGTPGSSTAPSAGGQSTPASGAGGDDTQTPDNSGIDIVLVVPNTLGDKAFSDLVWGGITAAKEKYGLGTIKCIELQGDTSSQVPTLNELCDLGDWDIIISGTFSLLEAISTVAEQYPDQTFIIYDTQLDYSTGNFDHCVSYTVMQNEGSLLGGALAALMSETGAIGFVGGGETTAVSDFLVGYIEGAQYVDENIKVYSSFIGNFTDASMGKELALAQYGQGADIIFAVASGAGIGVYEASAEKDAWSIGVDSDQALIVEGTNPDVAAHILTSVVKHLDVVLIEAIGDYLDGKLTLGEHNVVNLAGEGVGLADNDYFQKNVPAEVRAQLEEIAAKIAGGEIKVGTAIGMSAEGYEALKSSAL